MKFVWEMSEKDWTEFCNAIERGYYDNVVIAAGDYLGCCRVGDLCFDIRTWNDDEVVGLGYECFCGGVDSGYGYSAKEAMSNGNYKTKRDVPDELLYPYDEVGYDDFFEDYYSCSFDEFKRGAEKEFEEYIKRNANNYKEADLVNKANEELHVW